MLQVIKKEFDNLDALVEYVNKVSIKYGYLKDYNLIKTDTKYNALMNFDVPDVNQYLELASLENQIKEGETPYVYRTNYTIEAEDRTEPSSTFLTFKDIRNGLKIAGSSGFKHFYEYIKIEYDEVENSFTITLYNFKFESSMLGWHTEISETLLVDSIDYKIIYNHIVKLIQNRGYLLDFASLIDLEKVIFYSINWLNKKEFKD